jgi:hypothetical protein
MGNGGSAGVSKSLVPKFADGGGERHLGRCLGAEEWVEITITIGAKKKSLGG